MVTTIGVVVLIVGLICWIGQSLTFLAPSVAAKFGLLESEEQMDPTLYIIEARVQGLNDMLLTWTLPLSALLMLLEHGLWPYLGLIGGGIYIYFSGVIILARVFLKRSGKKVGGPSAERAAYVFGVIWILSSLAMIALAAIELSR